ncbi:MAG: hypothetical protein HDS88_04150 [Bacteroidales bacterium]|nr:hypothetical protein [Bacteroidales bacterium]
MMFVETIRIENGRLQLPELHQQRMAATIREVYGSDARVPDIALFLDGVDAAGCEGVQKCRVLYDRDICGAEITPYTPQQVRSLRVVEADIVYHLKSCDRSALMRAASLKGDCDEVIIVRDGLITDTSFTNLVFHGRDGLYTPREPLLRGVMRRYLLNKGVIKEADLTLEDIKPGNLLGITSVSMINAMLPLESAPRIDVEAIVIDKPLIV